MENLFETHAGRTAFMATVAAALGLFAYVVYVAYGMEISFYDISKPLVINIDSRYGGSIVKIVFAAIVAAAILMPATSAASWLRDVNRQYWQASYGRHALHRVQKPTRQRVLVVSRFAVRLVDISEATDDEDLLARLLDRR